MRLGQIAYEAYREAASAEWVSPNAFKAWPSLPPAIQESWDCAGLAAGNAAVEWTPATGADPVLPDVDMIVLIACPDTSEQVWLGYLDADDRWLTVDGGYIQVSHWREIPAPPRDVPVAQASQEETAA